MHRRAGAHTDLGAHGGWLLPALPGLLLPDAVPVRSPSSCVVKLRARFLSGIESLCIMVFALHPRVKVTKGLKKGCFHTTARAAGFLVHQGLPDWNMEPGSHFAFR